jgi:hypothetical protein
MFFLLKFVFDFYDPAYFQMSSRGGSPTKKFDQRSKDAGQTERQLRDESIGIAVAVAIGHEGRE